MTKLDALIQLRDKVKAGAFTPEPGGPLMPSYRAFTTLSEISLPQDVRALDVLAYDAYKGSLDAAKALHESVLPGWEWGVTCNAEQPNGPAAFVAEWGDYQNGFEAMSDTPARAWLLAILEALISQETGT